MPKFWTEERAARLHRLWTVEGWTAGQIEAELGCTRNAIISKVHREGWAQADARQRRARARTHTEVRRRPIGPLMPAPAGIPPAGGKSLMDLAPDDCRWPISEPSAADFRFCAVRRHGGLPYCTGHAQLAYNAWRP
jgi:GcrA cell cycle regulator